jgi:hypothetical protein
MTLRAIKQPLWNAQVEPVNARDAHVRSVDAMRPRRAYSHASMSRRLHPEITAFLQTKHAVFTEPELATHFKESDPAALRGALDRLVTSGHALQWQRADGTAGWSSTFVAHAAPLGWQVVTVPLTEESLQAELLELDPLGFTEFIEDVLRANADFSTVGYTLDFRFNLVATNTSGHATYFVTKRVRTTNERRVQEALESRRALHETTPGATVILVVPGVVTAKAAALATRDKLTIWDRAKLLSITPPEVVESYRAARRRESSRDLGAELLAALADIRPGRDQWNEYQGIVGRLIEYLFVPPLGVPALEISNESGADRRDLVMANMAESGTWALLRQMYRADYVVVDAKNHAEPLDKKPILEVAHYLKWYGPGLFALVACRQGFGEAGRIAAREQWIGSQRMIVPVTDEDFTEMVRLRQRSSSPEDILVETIRKFRLSL